MEINRLNRRLERLMRQVGFQFELDGLLEGKSDDYLVGFKDGYDLATDYIRSELEDFEKILLELLKLMHGGDTDQTAD